MQVVWFKRDLRVTDHAPLFSAAARGPCLCLYVYEPKLVAVPNDFIADRHTMPTALQQRVGCMIGQHYPAPIVDHRTAYNDAKRRM